MKSRRSADPDLHSQYESLLDQVWRSEADWRLWDRVDAFVLLESVREKRTERIARTHADGAISPDSPSENAA